MTLVEKLKAKGCWQTVIRPREHLVDRIKELHSVPDLLLRLSINRRGWDFPHVDLRHVQYGNDWVGQETEWNVFHELWRVARSGQFVHLGGIRYDWGEVHTQSVMQQLEPGMPRIGMGDSLHRLSEIFEFAQAWGGAIAGSEGVTLRVEIEGLRNRQLIVDDRWRGATSRIHIARAVEPFTWSGDIQPGTSLDELLARAREVATLLYARFGLQANAQVLEDWQQKIGR